MTDQEVFTAVFDINSINWRSSAEYNRHFLLAQENYFNHALKARGHVFLNEIHDALGLDRTSQGQLVGWLATNGNYIEFGAEDLPDDAFSLTFNVDGEIYEEI